MSRNAIDRAPCAELWLEPAAVETPRQAAPEDTSASAPPPAFDALGLPATLPPALEAGEPPEARGLARDEVRLMVSERATDALVHACFRDLPAYLDPGDLVVINTSGTLNAALPARTEDGGEFELHLSTQLPDGRWTVELRTPSKHGTGAYYGAAAGQVVTLPAGGHATLLAPYRDARVPSQPPRKRLWLAALDLPSAPAAYLTRYGSPIRYGHVPQPWPAEYYQTVYATEPGSAEMPSAGRPFSPEVITRLVARGVQIAPLLLHTGVSSLESDELPYEEYYRVSSDTAALVNLARARGKRVIAVGTTVVRALETVAAADGTVHPREGWTGLVITPDYRLRAVNGLLTGFHEPRSTHLAMLQALAGRAHLRRTYAEALCMGYLWHEFGDVHLIL
jgi:S-adenosylmethionine:tRNA ribosyltransferase-isomerase